MASPSESQRLDLLEKRVAELVAIARFQESRLVEIDKAIGVIDQQLIKTDAGLHQLARRLAVPAGQRRTRPMTKVKKKRKPEPKARRKRRK